MSNPFKASNRFNFLDNDYEDSNKNKDKNKDKNKLVNNTQITDDKHNNFLHNKKKVSINYNKKIDTEVLNKDKDQNKNKDIVLDLNNNFDELFPGMHNKSVTYTSVNYDDLNNSNINFKATLNNAINNNFVKDENKNIIKAGSVKLSYINNKVIYESGPLTKWEKKQLYKEHYEMSPTYVMSKAITIMEDFWDLDKNLYDLMNGEGSYEANFCLEPIYNSEDEDEDEYDGNDYDDLDEQLSTDDD